MLAHDNVLASIESFHRDHPADGAPDRLAAAAVAPARAGGRAVLRARRSAPTSSTSAAATRGSSSMRCATTGSPRWSSSRRSSTCSGAPSSARSRSAAATAAFDRLRGIARHLPMRLRPAPVRQRPRAARRPLPAVPVGRARSCRRRSSRAGRTSASRSSRATARPRPAPGSCTTLEDHGLGTVGRPPAGIEMRLADGRRDPVPRPDRVPGLLGEPDGHRRRVHRGRLVPDRRHRPPRRGGPAHPVGPDART